uniref:Uncharacterized protein n=1 Tax=Pseudocodium devriesii TaxID=453070 RepID=A0A386B113_9CHLO|nr:hypothetical protein [Pseudocodium devriesii]AYC65388.1 hypothetical protein [Pseudocodium devriesii]
MQQYFWNQELDSLKKEMEAFAFAEPSYQSMDLDNSSSAALEEFLDEFLNAARQQQLAILQAAPIIESEGELFAEISEFSTAACEAEMLEDLESLMPAYIRLPERPNPFKPIVYQYYSPQRPLASVRPLRTSSGSGYTIGPGLEHIEAGGGSDGGGDFFLLILFGSGVIVIGRVIGDYGYKILASGIEKYNVK